MGRPVAQPGHRSRLVGPERDRPTVGLRGEGTDIGRDETEPVRAQVEILDDGRADPADRVRETRHSDAAQLRGLRGTADVTAPLEHQGPLACLREIGGRDEGVVPRPDDDRVVAAAGGRDDGPVGGGVDGHQAALRPRERRTSSAAIRPFAPMIPPPGWVELPHSQRSRTGVRNRA